ncbi:MAG: PAS domain S-box protein [Desulfobacterales bacterium]|nr:PAS domain S-box protein [Desulfobacterales bacterium]
MPIRHRIRSDSLLIGIFAAAMILVMAYSTATGQRIAEQYAPLIQAASEIKLEGTTAHLWFEEIITGDRYIEIEKIWHHLDQSRWYAIAMLEGGSGRKGEIHPLEEPRLREAIRTTLAKISEFRTIAERRWHQRAASGVGSGIDQEFDRTFGEFIKSADMVETELQRHMSRHLKRFRWIQLALMGTIVVLAFGAGRIIRRYRKQLVLEHRKTKKEEEKLRITLSSIGDAVIATDTDGCISMMNPVAEHLTGWSLAEAKGRPSLKILNIFNARTGEPADDPVTRVLSDGKKVELANHTTLTSRSGQVYHIADSAAPIVGRDNETAGVVIVFRDITDAYRMRETIHKSEARLRAIMDYAEAVISVKDLSGSYLDANRQFEKLTGLSRREVIGLKDHDIFFPDVADSLKRNDRHVIDRGRPIQVEETIPGLTDNRYYVSVKFPLKNAESQTYAVCSISTDITVRKSVEKALKENEKQYRTLFEKSNDALFIVNPETGAFLEANQSALRLTGRSRDELRSLTFSDITTGQPGRHDPGYTASGMAELSETVFILPNGDQRIAVMSSVPIDDEKAIDIARDVTKERIMERQMRQTQKMEAIGRLAGGIAHDFNNILSGISGYAQLAKTSVETPRKVSRHIDEVLKGAKRASELIQHILTFSRQTEYERQSIPVDAEINSALKLLRATIPANIDIVTRIESGANINADPVRIHQLIMNLSTNAYHAMEDTGGILEVSLTHTQVSQPTRFGHKLQSPGAYLQLTVSDTGCGMDKETVEKIFEPYFTTKQMGRGTGLGLSLVQAIVEEHEGFMKVTSTPGEGTCFSIYFPVVAPRDQIQRTVQPPMDCTGSETIMIVDDERQIRDVYYEFLKKYGYRVECFDNGSDALDHLRQLPCGVDLVLTDLTMPGVTGDRLAKEVRKGNSALPILLCTGFSDKITETETKQLGINCLLYKPVSLHDLVKTIRTVLDENKE